MQTSTIRSFLACLLISCTVTSTAQFPQVYDHTITWLDDQHMVIFHAWFTYGSGSTCPPFQAIVNDDGEQIQLLALYNTLGPWPALSCSRTDTVFLTPGSCSLTINYAAIVHVGEDKDIISFGEPEEIDLCTPTGISSTGPLSGLQVHPTLFQDRIWIEWNDASSGMVEVQLLDALGRRVAGPWSLVAGERKELVLTGLINGIYVLEVRQGSGRKMLRIVKEY